MTINVITLFPEFFASPLKASLLGKAVASGIVQVNFVNPRDYSHNKHKKVDDTPYGGGAGMVMMVEPIALAVEAVKAKNPSTRVVLLSARGRLFNSGVVREYTQQGDITLICGHYEGVDERVAAHVADESLRLGNFVLSGGEVAALTVIDALARKEPGFMGNADSLAHESFDDGVSFEHAQYTRPEEWRGHRVPEILLSGNHAKIAAWRKEEAGKFSSGHGL
ncbi:MAG: tRNA (guanosine(37)-N1)-methyltransferase TrmD [Spirochaetes bacterium]|nr:tRNA (guanosine(37)-N1)-methyltransferase TrmD [Spirochaetota bacterium]